MTKEECIEFLKTIGDIDEIKGLAALCGSDEGRQELVDYIKAKNITCFGIWESDEDEPFLNYQELIEKALEICDRK